MKINPTDEAVLNRVTEASGYTSCTKTAKTWRGLMLERVKRNFNRQVYAEVLLQEVVNLSHREPWYGVLHVNTLTFCTVTEVQRRYTFFLSPR